MHTFNGKTQLWHGTWISDAAMPAHPHFGSSGPLLPPHLESADLPKVYSLALGVQKREEPVAAHQVLT
ncbi:hypothetical protein Are01nite_20700 [Actinoplanes regularis]|nr:hypothetical protein Are01nite_20700 [Actinoplanes regularis]